MLASATQYDLAAVLDQRPVRVCGIGSIVSEPSGRDGDHAQALVERIIEQAARDGAAMALRFSNVSAQYGQLNGFDVASTTEVELSVAESLRHGAPMTLIRGGEERALAAIVAMGRPGHAIPFPPRSRRRRRAVHGHEEATACYARSIVGAVREPREEHNGSQRYRQPTMELQRPSCISCSLSESSIRADWNRPRSAEARPSFRGRAGRWGWRSCKPPPFSTPKHSTRSGSAGCGSGHGDRWPVCSPP